jgi:D-inositol-3-phosphate glycosyltransferase
MDRSPAIAVLATHASPLAELGRGENGGMNLSVRRLCEGLAERGVPSDVFVRRESATAPRESLIAPGSRLVALDVGPRRPLPKEAIAELAGEMAAAIAEHADSEARAYRLLHAHYWLSGLSARHLRDTWGIPWVQSFHSLARMKSAAGLPDESHRADAEAALSADADRLVAMSRAEGRALVRLYGASRDRICVAEPGVDIRPAQAEAAALRVRLGLAGRRIVLFAGRLEPLKGADTLMEALGHLAGEAELDDVVTLVIGADSGDGAAQGGERRRLERSVSGRGLGDRVRFLGAVPHEQLGGYYALADICVVPSRVETFGLVALEAQAQGTPVIATRAGGLPEVIADGETGLLVSSRDSDELAAALALLLGDEAMRHTMGEAARQRARLFGWPRMVDRLLSIYSRVSDPHLPAEFPCGYEVTLAG